MKEIIFVGKNDNYKINFDRNGITSCSCPGFFFRGQCRHIKEMIKNVYTVILSNKYEQITIFEKKIYIPFSFDKSNFGISTFIDNLMQLLSCLYIVERLFMTVNARTIIEKIISTYFSNMLDAENMIKKYISCNNNLRRAA